MSSRKYLYPTCRKEDRTEDWFGTVIADPYAWFRDQDDPEVRDFTARENAFTDAYFETLPVEEKIRDLKQQKLPSMPAGIAPFRDGYVAAFLEEGDYEIRTLGRDLEAKGKLPIVSGLEGFYTYSALPCPKTDDIMALMVQKPGDARPMAAVCDMNRGSLLKLVPEVFSFCWSGEDGCLYYSTTRTDVASQCCRSVFNRYDPAADEEATVLEDDSNVIFGQAFASNDGRWVMAMRCHDYSLADWAAIDTVRHEVIPLTDHPVEWKYIDSQESGHCFIALNGGSRGALIRTAGPGQEEVLLAESELLLQDGFAAGGDLFVLACRDVSSRLLRIRPHGEYEEVSLPGDFGTLTRAGFDRDGVFLQYESFLTAPCILHYDGRSLRTVYQSRPGDTAESGDALADVLLQEHPDLVTEQRFAPSTQDGTRIPYYLVRRRDAAQDGDHPVLMYAYGGYNVSMPPWYQEMVTQTVVSDWVEKGGIYVHANIRGGNEYGPAWHEAGMGLSKRHCYEDFIGVAEAIIRDGWTRAGRIGIAGCSNGGLLMSALLTMRPDLWGCVIDSVPHTDMIHFAEDDRGPMYITEYGNPRESREMFEYLLSYSPYHNIRPCDYPPTYVQTGERDNNVPPYHGKKFAAGLQEANTSEAPILLRVLAEGTHDRGRGEVYWRTIAEMQVFLKHWLMS